MRVGASCDRMFDDVAYSSVRFRSSASAKNESAARYCRWFPRARASSHSLEIPLVQCGVSIDGSKLQRSIGDAWMKLRGSRHMKAGETPRFAQHIGIPPGISHGEDHSRSQALDVIRFACFRRPPEAIHQRTKGLANPTLERRTQRLFDEPLGYVVDAPQRGRDCGAHLSLHQLTRQRQILGDVLIAECQPASRDLREGWSAPEV